MMERITVINLKTRKLDFELYTYGSLNVTAFSPDGSGLQLVPPRLDYALEFGRRQNCDWPCASGSGFRHCLQS